MINNQLALWTFVLLGIIGIVAGGSLSAFSAKKASRLASWTSAYLVLVIGLFQVGIGMGLYYLGKDLSSWLMVLAFAAYNLGNAGVLLGTILKHRRKSRISLVDVGGVMLAASMVLFLVLVRHGTMSWQLVVFYIIVLVILITIPIGLTLSRR